MHPAFDTSIDVIQNNKHHTRALISVMCKMQMELWNPVIKTEFNV